jgi:hypothetical protein
MVLIEEVKDGGYARADEVYVIPRSLPGERAMPDPRLLAAGREPRVGSLVICCCE